MTPFLADRRRPTGAALAASWLALCAMPALGETKAPDLDRLQGSFAECQLPADLIDPRQPLPQLKAAVQARGPVRIVAIGSSSTSGVGASHASAAYPAQLEAMLKRAWPGVAVTVLNKGIGGEEAQQMLKRWPQDVTAAAPHVVVWQVGSNFILRNRAGERAAFEAAVRAGVAAARNADSDVFLMGPQWAPKLDAHAAEQAWMLKRLPALARELGVPYMDRHTGFKHWQREVGLQNTAWIGTDQLHPTDLAYRCTAVAVAAMLHRAVHP